MGGTLRCHPDGYDISKIEILFFDNRPVGSSTPFYVNGVQYGTVNFTNSGAYRWVTVASGSIPCSGSTASWNFQFSNTAGGQTAPTYYSTDLNSISDPNKPIILATRGTSTSTLLITYSPARLIAGAYYFNVPSTTITVDVNSSGGGSSGTTTVVTPNDDLVEFSLWFFLFLGISALFILYGRMILLRNDR